METSGQELMPDCYSKQLQHAAVFLLLLQTGYSASSQTSAGVIQGISILGGGGGVGCQFFTPWGKLYYYGEGLGRGGGGGGGGGSSVLGGVSPLRLIPVIVWLRPATTLMK